MITIIIGADNCHTVFFYMHSTKSAPATLNFIFQYLIGFTFKIYQFLIVPLLSVPNQPHDGSHKITGAKIADVEQTALGYHYITRVGHIYMHMPGKKCVTYHNLANDVIELTVQPIDSSQNIYSINWLHIESDRSAHP